MFLNTFSSCCVVVFCLLPWTESGQTRLHCSLPCFLFQGANPNCESKSGLPVLHLAAKNKHVDCIPVLVQAGADINAKGPSSMWVAFVVFECLLDWLEGWLNTDLFSGTIWASFVSLNFEPMKNERKTTTMKNDHRYFYTCFAVCFVFQSGIFPFLGFQWRMCKSVDLSLP